MFDLLIRGGTVVDGSGANRITADVGITDGRISAIGRLSDTARQTIDADGLVVAPGFIDGHTHMDAQVMWDPLGTSSCYNGVTSVVMSNCGFTLAPCKPADRDWYANCLSYVEDIPAAAMAAGMDWTWESFADYLQAVERRPKALNYAMYVGHSALRMYVMGRRAVSEAASEDEIATMARMAQEAMRAGAIGVSTSRSHTHMTPDGTPVASRLASWDEVERMVAAMAELNTGILQIGSDNLNHGANVAMLERLRHLTLTYKRTVMFGVVSTRQGVDPVSWRTQTQAIEDANRAGGRMFGQASTRSINAIYSLKSYLPYDVLPEWREVRARPLPEQLRMLRDPARRRALIAAEQRMKPKDNVLQGGGAATLDPRKPDYEQLFALKNMDWDDQTVAELSRARGTHPVETMIELSLDNPDQIYVWPVANEDREDVLGMLKYDSTLATFSDAGAHSAQEMGACLQTHFLHYWVNRRRAFTLEHAVRKMTHDIAEAFELKDRGLVKQGYKADLVLFEADRVRPCLPKVETDLPGGARRLVQKAEGIRATIVNGALTMQDGESTGTYTGEVMKGAAA